MTREEMVIKIIEYSKEIEQTAYSCRVGKKTFSKTFKDVEAQNWSEVKKLFDYSQRLYHQHLRVVKLIREVPEGVLEGYLLAGYTDMPEQAAIATAKREFELIFRKIYKESVA